MSPTSPCNGCPEPSISVRGSEGRSAMFKTTSIYSQLSHNNTNSQMHKLPNMGSNSEVDEILEGFNNKSDHLRSDNAPSNSNRPNPI
ncbi:hypothetical protein TNCV_4559891 [Trichonephila clavipes]|nr:hypothetical protein TNCV_4559891 [Trichonephila clavipes]